ncbi:MAG TPA: PH domain-containing protein [Jatrophihabitans sp.]|jgi:hypothetical protein
MRVFRLPTLAYLAVLLLIACTVPLAFAGNGEGTIIDHNDQVNDHSSGIGGLHVTPLIVLLVIPILAALYIGRTATFVSEDGIRVRAIFGSRTLPWTSIRGLETAERAVYAVIEGGAVRLPCVRLADLHAVAAASGGHLPDLPAPAMKSAPIRRRTQYLRRR